MKETLNGQTSHSTSEILTNDWEGNNTRFQQLFAGCDDIKLEYYRFTPQFQESALVIYCSTLVQDEKHNMLKLIVQDITTHIVGNATDIYAENLFTFLESKGITYRSVQTLTTFNQAEEAICSGHIIICFEGWNQVVSFEGLSVEARVVKEPSNELVIIGPNEGTIEHLEKNLGLIRYRLRTSDLKIKYQKTEAKSNTTMAYCYLCSTVDQSSLALFESKLSLLKGKEIADAANISELVFDQSSYSPFPQCRFTERPDVAVSALLEGKIIVIVDGSPTIAVCPGLFHEFFQSAADYYEQTLFTALIRLIRLAAFCISLSLPAIYIAITTFHLELIPTILFIAIIDSHEGIPFSIFLESLIMAFFFELLQEAAVRLPRPVGSTVSIVGALIIGESAINANIASPIIVVIIALTGISTLAIPYHTFGTATRILRLPLMVLASILGGLGLMIGFILIYLHMVKLRPLGQPYLSPLTPFSKKALNDTFFRKPSKPKFRFPGGRS